MALNNQEIVDRLSEIQDRIWETATLTVNESGTPLTFGSALSVTTRLSDLSAEMSGLICSIQFAFANQPEAYQVILISQDTLNDVVKLVTGDAKEEVDDDSLATVRPVLEAIVQGICLSVGTLRNSPVAASGLTIRYQELALPQNLDGIHEAVRMQVALSGEDANGAITWLMNPETAVFICGLEENKAADDVSPFDQLSDAHGGQGRNSAYGSESAPLEFLMDIPLEISVELGRVKMLVRDVIELGTGSIVEIDKTAGEPVDVMVNGRLVARGEVVVIEDNFGVRITEIVSPQERLMRLAEVA